MEINSTTLVNLNLSSNSISGSLMPSLRNCLFVDLSRNLLSDDMFVVKNCDHNLEALDLSSSGLRGSLPTIPPMESLDLSNNALTGELSSNIGNWGRLKLLNLSNNNLSGQI
ncbi:leucine-rich receptor-like protein kinase family protein [Striga asiatica]|uniref:Leucine-rich receptor-like protein kinase family protein n=1 Tax=Striga asiatica TaxID=4170 RepID=A0A5A7RC95_STRAF|nr:leucine-rich receptor-like protein kinase family protein [Striga asiatica]